MEVPEYIYNIRDLFIFMLRKPSEMGLFFVNRLQAATENLAAIIFDVSVEFNLRFMPTQYRTSFKSLLNYI